MVSPLEDRILLTDGQLSNLLLQMERRRGGQSHTFGGGTEERFSVGDLGDRASDAQRRVERWLYRSQLERCQALLQQVRVGEPAEKVKIVERGTQVTFIIEGEKRPQTLVIPNVGLTIPGFSVPYMLHPDCLVARAMLGKRVGQRIKVQTRKGEQWIRIILARRLRERAG